MYKYKLDGNKLTVTRTTEYELRDLELAIINQIKKEGKYVTHDLADYDEEVALRRLRNLCVIKEVPNVKKETHIFDSDVKNI